MSGRTRVLSLALVIVLVLAGCGSPSNSSGTTNRQSTFTTTHCSFTVGAAFNAGDVRCGYVSVPENRQLDDSQTIKVAVAIFKSQLANPAPDPLIYLEGGPGSQLIAPMGPAISSSGMPNYVGNRDLILVDQRGVGLSKPSLACRPSESLQQCRTRLVKNGTNLSAYNTVENAADIAELGPALGYKQVNLFGNSYGTTLALQVMRDYPQGIRSVVMDGVASPAFDVFNDYNAHTWQSMQQVFKDCAASSSCNTQYPHLQQTFIQLLARLQAHPVTLRVYSSALHRSTTVKLKGVDVWNGLREILPDPNSVPQVPQMIASLARGEYSIVQRVADASSYQPHPDSAGMKASMNCSGDQSRSSPATIAASLKSVPVSVRAAVIASEIDSLKTCTVWHVPSIAAVNHTYFSSTIPTLLLPGRYDPKTPPSFAKAMAPKLGHAYVIVIPTSSHGVVGYGICQDNIASNFLTNPNRKPDARCIASLTMPWI